MLEILCFVQKNESLSKTVEQLKENYIILYQEKHSEASKLTNVMW